VQLEERNILKESYKVSPPPAIDTKHFILSFADIFSYMSGNKIAPSEAPIKTWEWFSRCVIGSIIRGDARGKLNGGGVENKS
jgi:hypothetical protein